MEHIKAPLINGSPDDSDAMDDPQSRTVLAMPILGDPFTNNPGGRVLRLPSSPPPVWGTGVTPQSFSFDAWASPGFDDSHSNTPNHRPVLPRLDIPPLGSSPSDNGTNINLDNIPIIHRRTRSVPDGRISRYHDSLSEGRIIYPRSAHMNFINRPTVNLDPRRRQTLRQTGINRGHRKTTSDYTGGSMQLGAPNSPHISLSPSPHPSPFLGDSHTPSIPHLQSLPESSSMEHGGPLQETSPNDCLPGDIGHEINSSTSTDGNQDSYSPTSPRSSTLHQPPRPSPNPTQDQPSDDQSSTSQPHGLSYHPPWSNSPTPGAAVQIRGTQLSKNDAGCHQQLFMQVEPLHTMGKVSTAHGLLPTGSDNWERSGKQWEEVTKETEVLLVDLPTKPPPPQTSTLGVIPVHAHGIKLEGGPGSVVPDGPGDTNTTSVAESAIQCLLKRGFALPDRPSLIESVFSSKEGSKVVCNLHGDDAQSFIDVIDEALLEIPDLSPLIRKRCLKSLYRLCGHHALLPTAMKILAQYDRTGSALYRGGFADVWKGDYHGREVAVKVVRTYVDGDLQKIVGRFCKEVVTWRTLHHPNVLPLRGITMTKSQFVMISDWMGNGNINEFVKANPEADQLGLLRGVAKGLIYIHNQGMIHGDLKGVNILIDQAGQARLADFGLLTIISDPTNHLSSSSHTQGGTARWMGPELIAPQRFGLEKSSPTKSSDCYALGMVIYETISRHPPFHTSTDLTVFLKVLEGEHPIREVGFKDSLWEMLVLCWTPQPNARPSIEDVLHCLERVSGATSVAGPSVERVQSSYQQGVSAVQRDGSS